MVYEMLDAELTGDFHGLVGAPIVDDEQLNVINTGNLGRHILQHHGERLLLIQARNLNKQSHIVLYIQSLASVENFIQGRRPLFLACTEQIQILKARRHTL